MQDRDNHTGSLTPQLPARVQGTILLSYYDPDFRLNVTSEESHFTFAERPPYDDGLHDFVAANYDAQRDALLRMLRVGKSCEMVFRMEGQFAEHKDPVSLYFAKIYSDESGCFAEINPYHMDPTGDLISCVFDLELSTPECARQVFDLLYGGFVAAELDHMNNAWEHKDRMEEVAFFRRALEHVQEPYGLLSIVTQPTKQPLSTQIQSAQARCTPADKPAGERGHTQTNERG